MATQIPNELQVYKDASEGVRQLFNGLPTHSNPDYHVYFNDFLVAQDYSASDWTITTTEAGTGDASEAIKTAEVGGALLITNDNADNDADSLQSTNEGWKLQAGKKLWFEGRVALSSATDADLFLGLCITDTTPLASSDRVGFQVDDGSASIKALCCKDSAETNEDTEKDIVAATYVKLGFHFDGSNKVHFFVDRELVSTMSTNIPDDEELALTMHVQNGSATIRTLTVDYLWVVQER